MMAEIIAPGRSGARVQPWYVTECLTCPLCECVFRLDEYDFAKKHMGDHARPKDAEWRVIAVDPTPGAAQVIEGMCPYCKRSVPIASNAAPLTNRDLGDEQPTRAKGGG